MIRLNCKTAQRGFAVGKAYVIRTGGPEGYRQGDSETEKERLDRAVDIMSRKMRREKDPSGTGLMEAEMMLLEGDEFLGRAGRLIREKGLGAPRALLTVSEELCGLLEKSESEYLRERCEDIRGLAKSLCTIITQGGYEVPKEPCILVAHQLSAGELSMIGTDNILGILTGQGSPTSHVSILAGELGLPCMYGADAVTDHISDGDLTVMDTDTGCVWVNPSEAELEEMLLRREKSSDEGNKEEAPSVKKGTGIRICANISTPREAAGILEKGAEGIGLMRSEFLFMNRNEAPTEEEQFTAYRSVLSAMEGRETVIRTMDTGSDKKVAYLAFGEERNPALGMRGIRVSLAYRELFETQLCALLRAALFGDLKIMFPMVTVPAEFESALDEIRLCAARLDERGERYRIPPLGVMIETPAAVMLAPELARKADFFSIGTNDLIQYAFAMDREAGMPDEYGTYVRRAVMGMIDMTLKAAHENQISVSVCGELAGDPDAALMLARLGVDALSVSVSKISGVRRAFAGI